MSASKPTEAVAIGPSLRAPTRAVIVALLLGSFVGGVVSCRKVATVFDCRSVCGRYRDCIDLKYDVAKCQARCRQRAGEDTYFQQRADACEACIKGHSCMGATFECGGKCIGVVP